MHDIVFKKVESTSASDTVAELPSFPDSPPTSRLDAVLNFLNHLGGWFHNRFSDYDPEVITPARELVAEKGKLKVNAWITPWNISDMTSTAPLYGTVSAFWLTLSEDGFNLAPKADWSIWQQFHTVVNNPNQKKLVTITADPNFSY